MGEVAVLASERCCYKYFDDEGGCPARAVYRDAHEALFSWCPNHAHPGDPRLATRGLAEEKKSDG